MARVEDPQFSNRWMPSVAMPSIVDSLAFYLDRNYRFVRT
jgi:hypothetical protein